MFYRWTDTKSKSIITVHIQDKRNREQKRDKYSLSRTFVKWRNAGSGTDISNADPDPETQFYMDADPKHYSSKYILFDTHNDYTVWMFSMNLSFFLFLTTMEHGQ